MSFEDSDAGEDNDRSDFFAEERDFSILRGRNPNSTLFSKNYFYYCRVRVSSTGKIYLRCHDMDCEGTAYINAGRDVLTHNRPHSTHLEEFYYEDVETARREIAARVWPAGETPRVAFQAVRRT